MKTYSIGQILILIVASLVTPACLIAIVFSVKEYEDGHDYITSATLQTAHALSLAVDGELASLQSAVLALSYSGNLQTGDLAAFYDEAQKVLRNTSGFTFVLADRNGQQLLNTLKPYGAALPPHGNQDLVDRVFQTGKPFISDLFIGGVTHRYVFSISTPVIKNGEVIYSLDIGVFPERFSKILEGKNIPAEWLVSIFDRTGVNVARSKGNAQFIGAQAAPALFRQMALATEGVVETDTLEGIPVFYIFSRSARTGWSVAIGVPRAALHRQLMGSIWLTTAGTLLLLAFGLLLARLASVRVTRSMNALLPKIAAFGRGEQIAMPLFPLKEANDLGQALFNASHVLWKAQYLSMHDGLTSLANRALFNVIVAQHLETCKRTGNNMAILFIDLDGFKGVNDQYGHHIGDQLLCAVATRIQDGIRTEDVAARFGGDEFAVLLVHANAEAAALVADKLVELASAPYHIGSIDIQISASIGVAIFPESGIDSETLILRADEMMYEAKHSGKGCYSVAT